MFLSEIKTRFGTGAFEKVRLWCDINYNAEILHSESNKGKREFMEMLYIKREGTYSINLQTDLVKWNGCYDSMISYL